jgi:predicted nucleic acid-binding protein
VPNYFFDSSALVKRYHQEPGSDWVRAACDPRGHPPLYLSQLAHVEVVAALRRTGRREGIHHSFVDTMVNIFERHISLSDPARGPVMYQIIPVSTGIIALAVRLCNTYWALTPYPLRSLDAIQLASAIVVAAGVPGSLTLVTADVRLSAVAQLQGLQVVNPAYPPPSTSTPAQPSQP